MLAKIFKPNGEKIFAASVPFMPIVPLVVYVVFNFLFDLEGNVAGMVFSTAAFFCYNLISLFAIPFEGIFGTIGMLEYGGGIFGHGMLGINFFGILLVQAIYAAIFYAVFSISFFMRSGKRMRHAFGAKG